MTGYVLLIYILSGGPQLAAGRHGEIRQCLCRSAWIWLIKSTDPICSCITSTFGLSVSARTLPKQ